jgi:hypothetical protein
LEGEHFGSIGVVGVFDFHFGFAGEHFFDVGEECVEHMLFLIVPLLVEEVVEVEGSVGGADETVVEV